MRLRQRNTVYGYLDMGRAQIPPLPPYTVFTDRADGTLWLLSYTGTDPDYVIVLDDDLPTTPDVEFYDPLDGPYVGRGRVKLFVEGGVLQGELADTSDATIRNRRIFARVTGTNTMLEITAPDDWVPGDPIVVVPIPGGDSFPYPSIGHMSIPFVIMGG